MDRTPSGKPLSTNRFLDVGLGEPSTDNEPRQSASISAKRTDMTILDRFTSCLGVNVRSVNARLALFPFR
jgi:hypothetical protein